MNLSDLAPHPHRRFNPLTREWVLVSSNRTERPWQGQVENVSAETLVAYDPECYLCPGNARAGGIRNPAYADTFVFDNDFAALKPSVPSVEMEENGLFLARTEAAAVAWSAFHHGTISRWPA